jgi:hypothetical protein
MGKARATLKPPRTQKPKSDACEIARLSETSIIPIKVERP